jgi:hypothetical protein
MNIIAEGDGKATPVCDYMASRAEIALPPPLVVIFIDYFMSSACNYSYDIHFYRREK